MVHSGAICALSWVILVDEFFYNILPYFEYQYQCQCQYQYQYQWSKQAPDGIQEPNIGRPDIQNVFLPPPLPPTKNSSNLHCSQKQPWRPQKTRKIADPRKILIPVINTDTVSHSMFFSTFFGEKKKNRPRWVGPFFRVGHGWSTNFVYMALV